MNMNSELGCRVTKDLNESMHFHPELEVIYVVAGEAEVVIQDMKYQMEKHDVIAVNPGLPHEIKSAPGTMVCTVVYSSRMLAGILDRRYGFFECNSVCGASPYYGEIETVFEEIIYQFLNTSKKTQCRRISLLYQLLDCLTEHFMEEEAFGTGEEDEDTRYRQILSYVNQHFSDNISLSELAEQMYVSSSTLSRFFKKKTQMYFVDYVNHVRVRAAQQELEYSEKNITKIAVDSGFSNLSVFNRAFREIVGMTPTEYRTMKQENYRKTEEERRRQTEQTLLELRTKEKEGTAAERIVGGTVEAEVDASSGEKREKIWNQAVNAGNLNSLLLANVQYHILYLQENLQFRYVRVWNIFSRKLMITDGEHTGYYNYDKVDTALDFLVSHRLIPFLDLGVRPDTAVRTEGEHVYFEDECIEFHSREAWEAMCADFIRHIISRYGKEEVGRWVFEISLDVTHRERSRCYADENYDHYNAYAYFSRTLKAKAPEAQVGVNMATAEITEDLRSLLLRSREEDCVPDFVAFLLFPYISYRKKDKYTYRRDTYRNSEIHQLNIIRNLIRETGAGCRLYVSEWNNTISNRNYLNDSCFRAAYMVHKLKDMWDLADLTAVWMATDWMSNYFDTPGIANGGSGLLTKNTICKPAYFAIQFMNSLGDYLVEKGQGYIITRTEQGNFYILCYNYKWYSSNYFMGNENLSDPGEIDDLFENSDPLEIRIGINGMKADRTYAIKGRTLSSREGNILVEWKNFGFENHMTENDVKYIRQACYPRMHMERKKAENGRLAVDVVLNPHEVTLLHIFPADEI